MFGCKYVSMEMENSRSTVYFNHEREKNGIFSKLDTGERQSIPQTMDQRVRYGEFEDSLKRFLLKLARCLTQARSWTTILPSHLRPVKSHGHTLGVVGHMMHSYCASCKAGLGIC